MRELQISITVAGLSRIYGNDLAGVIELARIADDVGIDQVALPDHVAIGPRTDRYPYGPFPLPADEPWLEPLTTLAAMAAVTKRVRLATGILIAPLRSPALLAKSAATLDVLSGGRLDLGVGVGWQEEEYEASAVPFGERWRRMDDTLRACRALWRDAPASFASETVAFEGIYSVPQPVQPGGVPLWFGIAPTERGAQRMAEFGSGWMPMEAGPDDLREGIRRIHAALASAGRDSSTFGVRAHVPVARSGKRPDLAATLAGLPALAEAGATVASIALAAFAGSVAEVRPFLESVGRGLRS
ncbi:MAG: LLM class F420-dependent oxidoreductase [Myxococcota bacterium]